MALHVKSLNNDTTFLLTFTSPICPPTHAHPSQFPGSFTILVDPWIRGAAQILSPSFSYQERASASVIDSLADIDEPDLVLVSQDKPDHCHEESLCTLPSDTYSTILAPATTSKKIRGWSHFKSGVVRTLPVYEPDKPETVFRIEIPSFSPQTTPGEVTISLLQAKWDMMLLHNGIGITYRPPHTILSETLSYIDLPTPPTTPSITPSSSISASTTASTPTRIHAQTTPAALAPREKAISVLYTPHGLATPLVARWASSHLLAESALPLSLLLHAFNAVDGPWFFGGNYIAGMPGGIDIVRTLRPRVWIGAHDDEKRKKGVATKGIAVTRAPVERVRELVDEAVGRGATEVRTLAAGEQVRIAPVERVRSKKSLVDMLGATTSATATAVAAAGVGGGLVSPAEST